MCDLASGYIHKDGLHLRVAHPCSHSATRQLLKLHEADYREWEYTQAGGMAVRRHGSDPSEAKYVVHLRRLLVQAAGSDTRAACIQWMKGEAGKHGIYLVSHPDDIDILPAKCKEIVIALRGSVALPKLEQCSGSIYANAATSVALPKEMTRNLVGTSTR